MTAGHVIPIHVSAVIAKLLHNFEKAGSGLIANPVDVKRKKGFNMFIIHLKNKADRAVVRRHPWIFSGAVNRVEGNPGPGDVVRVVDGTGKFLAAGHYSPRSTIRVRLLEWSEDTAIDAGWWEKRLDEALERRRAFWAGSDVDAFRLVFSESDLLPGLIVDWYAGYAVMQCLTAGVDRIKHELADILLEKTGAKGVFERSDIDARAREGLENAAGPLAGQAPPETLEIKEGGFRFLVDVIHGQKTGFFLDQRFARQKVSQYGAGRDVLDCFAYTNGFAVNVAAAGAASVVRVESSEAAVKLGEANLELNHLNTPGESIVGDAFQVLRRFRDQRRSFDLIILDPPKFAASKASVSRASRGYKDINLLALKLLRPGGMLATFSCSQGVDADLFQKIVFGASLDAGREAQIVDRFHQGPDHPVRLSFPESYYLKGLLCRVIS